MWGGGAGAIEDCEVFANNALRNRHQRAGKSDCAALQYLRREEFGHLISKNGLGVIEDCDIHGNDEAEVAITEGSNTVCAAALFTEEGAPASSFVTRARTVERCACTVTRMQV